MHSSGACRFEPRWCCPWSPLLLKKRRGLYWPESLLPPCPGHSGCCLAWCWTQAGLHFSQFQRLEFKIKVPAGSVSGENPLPGSRPSGFPAPGAAWGGGGPGPAWQPAPLRLRRCPTPGRAPCHEGQCVCAVLLQARSVLSAAQGRARLPSCCPVSPCRLNGCKLFGHLSRSLV